MNKIADPFTAFIKKAIDILFIQNPIGTSFGVFLGMLINTLTKLFKPLLKTISLLDFNHIKEFEWVIIGVVIVNFPTLFTRPKFDQGIEGAFIFIREAKKSGKLSDTEIRQMYRNLYIKVLDKINLDESTNREMTQIEEIIKNNNPTLGI